MERFLMLLLVCTTMSVVGFGQTYMDLDDDIEIPSDSWVIFNPGNYELADTGDDGLVQIDGKENIILDGSGVFADGLDYSGYMIRISNSSNIEIKNFGGASKYFYAVYITGSDHILIENNDFSYNKVDSAGWIYIWTNYDQALGGGVMMYETQFAQVLDNVMKFQNDGVALYHCDSIIVQDNDFAWNTSYGIRMYFTDDCVIQDNIANHVNRPFTDPSDCAAILLLVSNNNYVVNNDFSYSGDGIFLGQYQYAQILNNNYFAYNECSYSPHNAIEATFADGNVYEYNNCNYSHYGFWLGYSFNSIVKGNEVIGNQYAGIAIDRGYNNQILENAISSNPTGIELWEGTGISPYQNQDSRGYGIHDNIISGNRVAISLINSEESKIAGNEFLNNRNGIYFEGDAGSDTVESNVFSHTAFYHMENQTDHDILAVNNSFLVNDEAMIACNIYDKADDPGLGEVIWQPYVSGEDPVFLTEIPDDMAEPEAIWTAYPEACWGYGLPVGTTVEWDYQEKVYGEASVHVSTGNGWDIGVMYRPAGGQYASWSLNEEDTLTFYLKSANSSPYGFQFCSIILGNDCGGYYKYTASAGSILNPSIGTWKKRSMPLAGASPWTRTTVGEVTFDEISYVEIHADTWDHGFDLWLDAVTFNGDFTFTGESAHPADQISLFRSFPNPAGDLTTLSFFLRQDMDVQLSLTDINGVTRYKKDLGHCSKGGQQLTIDVSGLSPGVYMFRLTADNGTATSKFVISKP